MENDGAPENGVWFMPGACCAKFPKPTVFWFAKFAKDDEPPKPVEAWGAAPPPKTFSGLPKAEPLPNVADPPKVGAPPNAGAPPKDGADPKPLAGFWKAFELPKPVCAIDWLVLLNGPADGCEPKELLPNAGCPKTDPLLEKPELLCWLPNIDDVLVLPKVEVFPPKMDLASAGLPNGLWLLDDPTFKPPNPNEAVLVGVPKVLDWELPKTFPEVFCPKVEVFDVPKTEEEPNAELVVGLPKTFEVLVGLPKTFEVVVEPPKTFEVVVEFPKTFDVVVGPPKTFEVVVGLPKTFEVVVEFPKTFEVGMELPKTLAVDEAGDPKTDVPPNVLLWPNNEFAVEAGAVPKDPKPLWVVPKLDCCPKTDFPNGEAEDVTGLPKLDVEPNADVVGVCPKTEFCVKGVEVELKGLLVEFENVDCVVFAFPNNDWELPKTDAVCVKTGVENTDWDVVAVPKIDPEVVADPNVFAVPKTDVFEDVEPKTDWVFAASPKDPVVVGVCPKMDWVVVAVPNIVWADVPKIDVDEVEALKVSVVAGIEDVPKILLLLPNPPKVDFSDPEVVPNILDVVVVIEVVVEVKLDGDVAFKGAAEDVFPKIEDVKVVGVLVAVVVLGVFEKILDWDWVPKTDDCAVDVVEVKTVVFEVIVAGVVDEVPWNTDPEDVVADPNMDFVVVALVDGSKMLTVITDELVLVNTEFVLFTGIEDVDMAFPNIEVFVVARFNAEVEEIFLLDSSKTEVVTVSVLTGRLLETELPKLKVVGFELKFTLPKLKDWEVNLEGALIELDVSEVAVETFGIALFMSPAEDFDVTAEEKGELIIFFTVIVLFVETTVDVVLKVLLVLAAKVFWEIDVWLLEVLLKGVFNTGGELLPNENRLLFEDAPKLKLVPPENKFGLVIFCPLTFPWLVVCAANIEFKLLPLNVVFGVVPNKLVWLIVEVPDFCNSVVFVSTGATDDLTDSLVMLNLSIPAVDVNGSLSIITEDDKETNADGASFGWDCFIWLSVICIFFICDSVLFKIGVDWAKCNVLATSLPGALNILSCLLGVPETLWSNNGLKTTCETSRFLNNSFNFSALVGVKDLTLLSTFWWKISVISSGSKCNLLKLSSNDSLFVIELSKFGALESLLLLTLVDISLRI